MKRIGVHRYRLITLDGCQWVLLPKVGFINFGTTLACPEETHYSRSRHPNQGVVTWNKSGDRKLISPNHITL